jgi:tetratricopeptide (TPR) repeat protein
MLRHGLAFALVIGMPAVAGAQSSAACNTPACAQQNQLWAPAAQIHEIKNQFVAAVRQFTEAVAGAYGDEGPRLSSSLDALSRTLSEWDAAIRTYETVIAARPDDAEARVALATVYLDRHRPDDALRQVTAAGRIDGRRPDVHTIGALAHGLGNRPSQAAEALRAALRLDAGDPMTLYGLAQQLYKMDRRDQAADALRRFQESEWARLRRQRGTQASVPFERVNLLRQVAGASPIFPLHAYRPGFALLLEGKYDAAIGEFKLAAAADPLVGHPVVAEYASALRRGQLEPAVAGLESFVRTATGRGSGEALRILGSAYWVDGQFDQSAKWLNDAIRLDPEEERARLALADVLVDAGKLTEAEDALESAIAAIPDSGRAHYRLGQLYQSQSLFPQAVRELEAAARLTPLVGLDRLYETIGAAYSHQADFDRVVSAYLKRIDANPNNAGAHKSLGDIYFLQGRDDEALAEFAVTLLIDPRNSGALAGASQVYLRLGRFDEALDTSKQALALDARLKDARYALAISLLRLGKTADGQRELDVFQRMQAEVMANAQRQSELNATLRDAGRSLKSGEFAAAAAQLRKALTYDANSASVNRDLGLALIKAGQFEPAIQALDRAAQLSDSAGVHELMASAYDALGRPTDGQAQTAIAARLTERAKAERLQRMAGAR